MEIPVKKNYEYIVDIIDNGFGGEGIAKIDNFTIFNLIPSLPSLSLCLRKAQIFIKNF